MNFDIENTNYSLLEDCLSISDGGHTEKILLENISELRFYSRTSIGRLSGHLFLDIYHAHEKKTKQLTLFAKHHGFFGADKKPAAGEEKWLSLAKKLHSSLKQNHPNAKLSVWKSNWIWLKRLLYGSLLAVVPVGMIAIVYGWYFDLLIPSKALRLLPGMFALSLLLFASRKEIKKAFRTKASDAHILNFENIRDDI